MPGPLKTLFLALGASQFMQGVSLAFGEEQLAAQDLPLPYVVMVPRRGAHSEPGYAVDGSGGSEPDSVTKPPALDENIDTLWQIAEQIQFYIWAASTAPNALPVDHADTVETVRLALLSALRDQRAQTDGNGNVYYGLGFKSLGEEWETMQNAVNRFGRALIVTVEISVPVVMAAPTSGEVTPTTTQFNPTVNNQPG